MGSLVIIGIGVYDMEVDVKVLWGISLGSCRSTHTRKHGEHMLHNVFVGGAGRFGGLAYSMSPFHAKETL